MAIDAIYRALRRAGIPFPMVQAQAARDVADGADPYAPDLLSDAALTLLDHADRDDERWRLP